MKTTLCSITFYPVNNLLVSHPLVQKVLAAVSWKFQNETRGYGDKQTTPEYPLLIPTSPVEIEIVDDEVFIIRNSEGEAVFKGVLGDYQSPFKGTEKMLQDSRGCTIYWAHRLKEWEPIGKVTLVWFVK